MYVLTMRWMRNNTLLNLFWIFRDFLLVCESMSSGRRGGTRENFRLHFTICDCNNLHGSMHNLNFSCAARRRDVEGFVNVRSPRRRIPPDDRSTVPTARTVKLSERLFNELHFSDPVLFDAKYLVSGTQVFSKTRWRIMKNNE